MTITHHFFLTAAIAVGIGCSSAGASGEAGMIRRSSMLTAEEIAKAHADLNTAYDAVARLRPNWLAPHGANAYAKVFVNGQPTGDLASLRQFQAFYVASIRYYDVTESTARFGVRGGDAGVIDVTLRSP